MKEHGFWSTYTRFIDSLDPFGEKNAFKVRIFSKFEANRSRGSWVMIGYKTNRQTLKQILLFTIYIIVDSLIDSFNESLVGWLIDWLVDWFIDSLIIINRFLDYNQGLLRRRSDQNTENYQNNGIQTR